MYTIKQVLPCYVSQQCLSLQLQQNTAYVYHLKNSIAFCSALSENKKRGKKVPHQNYVFAPINAINLLYLRGSTFKKSLCTLNRFTLLPSFG